MLIDREIRELENRIREIEYKIKCFSQPVITKPFKPKIRHKIRVKFVSSETEEIVIKHVRKTKERQFLDLLNIPEENRQKSVGKYKVDALENGVVYEFLGDYWHGNLSVYKPDDISHFHEKFICLNEKTFKRLNEIKKEGFVVKYIWESDWDFYKKGLCKSLNLITL